jgi:CRISPR-associated protein Cas2
MYVVIVYDTDQKNCTKLHKQLKKYLMWNQRSVFEGNVTEAEFKEVRHLLEQVRHPDSHIVFYKMANEKMLEREEIGQGNGNISNIL